MTPELTNAVEIKDAPTNVIKWVQGQLIAGNYLQGSVDGLVGRKTIAALTEFKRDNYLEFPTLIGSTTLEALSRLEGSQDVSEQVATPTRVNADLGTQTGNAGRVPGISRIIYSNELIVQGIPLTWGEVTKDLTRIPHSKEITGNIVALTKVFGVIRDKFGAPLAITSAYRPPALKIGATNSQHKYGRALDMVPSNGNFKKLLDILKATPEINGIGLGQHKGFLHGDIRPGNGAAVIWRY